MKKYFFSLVLFVVGALSMNAQNTGYMGSRFFINADVSLNPKWLNMNFSDADKGFDYLGVNVFCSPNIEAVIWEKGSIGVGYNFVTMSESVKMTDYATNISSGNLNMAITAHGFNVFYKQYFGNTIAPMGHFFKVTLDGFFISHKVKTFEEVLDEASSKRVMDYVASEDAKNFGLKLEYGYDFLLFNRLRVTSGLSVGFLFKGFSIFGSENFYDSMEMTQGALSGYTQTSLFKAYCIGIHVGIGLLAF